MSVFETSSSPLSLRYIVNPDNKLTLRAQRDIKQGEEVTIQYISFLFGNSKRLEEKFKSLRRRLSIYL